MRLTGGEFSGRLIEGPSGPGVRPTSSMVRKALFDTLGDIQELSVLDLFSGTGALGLESLSRGAKMATLVDRNAETIRTNAESLGILDRCRIMEGNAGPVVARLQAEGQRFDLVLMDPPWSEGQSLLALAWSLVAPGGRLMLEFATRRPPPKPDGFPEGRLKVYGDTSLIIFSKEGARP